MTILNWSLQAMITRCTLLFSTHLEASVWRKDSMIHMRTKMTYWWRISKSHSSISAAKKNILLRSPLSRSRKITPPSWIDLNIFKTTKRFLWHLMKILSNLMEIRLVQKLTILYTLIINSKAHKWALNPILKVIYRPFLGTTLIVHIMSTLSSCSDFNNQLAHQLLNRPIYFQKLPLTIPKTMMIKMISSNEKFNFKSYNFWSQNSQIQTKILKILSQKGEFRS